MHVNIAPPLSDASAPEDPQGQVPNPYIYKLSETNATKLAGGALKVADSRNFTVATTISLAEVWVEPGGMRRVLLQVFWLVILTMAFLATWLRELHVSGPTASLRGAIG